MLYTEFLDKLMGAEQYLVEFLGEAHHFPAGSLLTAAMLWSHAMFVPCQELLNPANTFLAKRAASSGCFS